MLRVDSITYPQLLLQNFCYRSLPHSMANTSSPARTWDFTLNNYTDEEIEVVKRWATEVKKITVSKEIGEEGTAHLQGRVTFARVYRLSALKKLLPRAHWEQTIAEQDSLYILKAGSEVIVQVDNRQQGKRNDIAQACEMVKKSVGKSRPLRDVAKEMPTTFVRYYKGLEALANELVEDRTEVPTVTVLYGKTGTGKSRRAREILANPSPAYWTPANDKWFDGYCGQTEYLFEEFRGQLPYGMMLSLLDRYTTNVQVKGGMRRFVATNIVITSPLHPSEWYPNLAANDKIDQLMRRITTIECLDDSQDNILTHSTTVRENLDQLNDPLDHITSSTSDDGDSTICDWSDSSGSSSCDSCVEASCSTEGRESSSQEDQGRSSVPQDSDDSADEDGVSNHPSVPTRRATRQTS